MNATKTKRCRKIRTHRDRLFRAIWKAYDRLENTHFAMDQGIIDDDTAIAAAEEAVGGFQRFLDRERAAARKSKHGQGCTREAALQAKEDRIVRELEEMEAEVAAIRAGV